MEHYLHQNVAKFFSHACNVFIVNSFDIFVNFFNEIATDGLVSLLNIPRATTGFAQSADNINKRLYVHICIRAGIYQFFFRSKHFHLVLIFAKFQKTFRHGRQGRNISTSQMVDVRLTVKLKQFYRATFFIGQTQVTQEEDFVIVIQVFHQGNLQIRSNKLAINLGNHQRIFTSISHSFKILGVNNSKTCNGVNAQIYISQVKEAHSRFNNQGNFVFLCLFAKHNNCTFCNQRATGNCVHHVAFHCCIQNSLHYAPIYFFKVCAFFVETIARSEINIFFFQFCYGRMHCGTQNYLGITFEQAHGFQGQVACSTRTKTNDSNSSHNLTSFFI